MFSDLKFAFRQLRRTPGFTVTVMIVLALGIGATTAIFSVVNAVLLHPFPYEKGNEILFVGCAQRSHDGLSPVIYPDFLEWQKRAQTVDDLAFASGSASTLTGIAEPVVLRQGAVSASVWPLLGMQPILGRIFTADEDRVGATPVCVLSYATWKNRFGGAPDILNRTITLDDQPYVVVGVMPPAFKFWAADIWTPVGLKADTEMMRSRVMHMDTWVVTRPKAGRTAADVQTELSFIEAQIVRQHPDTDFKGTTVAVRLLRDSVTGPFQQPLFILSAAVASVLLIACANIANLLLARTSARQREFAVRAALGASRGQLILQTLMESLPLALLGGVVGLGIAVWGLDGLLAILPQDAVPAEAQIRVNGTVMAFSFLMTMGTMVLFSLLPAFESSRASRAQSLQEGARGTASRRTGRMRATLIVAEVALSLTLLVGAGLLLRSLARLSAVDLGFDRRNLLIVPLQLPEQRYAGSEQATTFFEDAVAQIKRLPAVASVAASTNVPFAGSSGIPLVVEGRTYTSIGQLQQVVLSLVTPGYFRAQGLQLVHGRVFEESDRAGAAPVIILNEAAVKKFLPDGDPLGKQVMLGAPDNLIKPGMLPPGFDKFHWSTVVGVVKNARHFGLEGNPPPAAYIPVRQGWDYGRMRRSMFLVVRTHDEPLAVVPAIRGVIHSLDPTLPIEHIQTMDMLVSDSLQSTRFNTILLGLFAMVALALAVVGIYGVVAWNVTQRTREIGVRVALGATRGDVLQLVIGQSMRVVAAGILLGIAGSLAVARAMQGLLFNLSVFDPVTFLAVAGLLAFAALVACWLPAKRATKVDPMVALRAE